MLRSFGPTFLTLSLAVPGASLALGLGDIHVQSALHQPLRAQIDLVGATDDDLSRLTARIAAEETFERYGLQRPLFLAGTTAAVSRDSQGRPVLVLRSTENFIEPAVTFLVDVHTSNGELIREYTILLDPPGLAAQPSPAAEPSRVEPAPAVPVPAAATESSTVGASTEHSTVAPERSAVAPETTASGRSYIVARRDTLDRIATIAGAHSRSDRRRMMIAIFRANPSAFQRNVNHLRSGVTLHFPTSEQLSAISVADANREYAAQMSAWHAAGAPAIGPVATNSSIESKQTPQPDETQRAVLTQRIESLEKSLDEVQRELRKPIVMPTPAPAAAKPEPVTDANSDADDVEDDPAPVPVYRNSIALSAVGLAVLVAGVWFYRRRRNRSKLTPAPRGERTATVARDLRDYQPADAGKPAPSALPPAENEGISVSPKVPRSESDWLEESFSIPISDLLANDTTLELPPAQSQTGDTTAVLAPAVETAGDTVERKPDFFNPESDTNATHVILGSGPDEPGPFVERRKSPADVLRQAIEREPQRSDLCLKLLELYYTAAAQNKRAFLEVAHQLAKNDKLASAEDWARIADMGRAIAPEDDLFCATVDDKAVA